METSSVAKGLLFGGIGSCSAEACEYPRAFALRSAPAGL